MADIEAPPMRFFRLGRDSSDTEADSSDLTEDSSKLTVDGASGSLLRCKCGRPLGGKAGLLQTPRRLLQRRRGSPNKIRPL